LDLAEPRFYVLTLPLWELFMENSYYSKKLDRYFSKRLDFLIYAHDGRGLGHASRGIAIGMAIRRLFPQCKTLFVSGCKQGGALIGPAPLDWVKLPSYETTIIEGKVEGSDGDSNFYKSVLGQLRTEMLASIVRVFKPRIALVDHAPSGRREELHRALEETKDADTLWVLGLRGIIGDDKDVWSDYSVQLFREHYHSILWYGDTNVLGRDYPNTVESHFGAKPVETGYVSRLNEIKHLIAPGRDPLAGTISIPWGSDATWAFVRNIHSALAALGDTYGRWHLFVAREKKGTIRELFKDLSFCTIEEVSERYVPALLNSKAAMVYAGYNSLTDVLAAQIPSVVLLRDVEDTEQEDHLTRLIPFTRESIHVLSESNADSRTIRAALEKQLHAPLWGDQTINIRGAEIAASVLVEGVRGEE
jgi:predicted glycosyltransferase